MKFTSKAVSFSFLFLAVLSTTLFVAAPKAFAQERGTVQASVPPPHLVVKLGFKPSILGVVLPVELSFDSDGNLSIAPTNEWEVMTPIGVVTLSGSLSTLLLPQLSSQAQQTSMSGSDLLLIIRHKQGASLQDANYLLQAKQNIQSVDIQGVITEVSVRWTSQNYMVFVDASHGDVSGITLQGVSAGTTSTVKIGCPDPNMLAWSMNLGLGSLKAVSGPPCTFQWTNPDASVTNWVSAQATGNDSLQCPIGYGSASVQLSFPWWHFWDQGETQKCDGKNATTINDMGVAGSAAITFKINATVTNSTTATQTCLVILANGLNIRAAPTSQSALIAHYPNGTVLNFVQVVNGENVNGNSLWGRSEQGHYFWLGGTDHSNG